MSFSKIRASLFPVAFAASIVALSGDGLEGSARAHDDAHLPFPQLVTFGGPVVSSPRIVPIVFASDPDGAKATDYLGKLAHDRGFAASLAEYGVGAATVAPPVILDGPAPPLITTTQIEAFLSAKFGTAGFPQPDASSVYVVLYPQETEVDRDEFSGFTFNACFGTGAFHRTVASSNLDVPYVVTPHCDGFMQLTGIDEVTVTLGTELVGTLTNPSPRRPAYIGAAYDGSGWELAEGGGEAAEFCVFAPDGVVRPPSIGYATPRIWSNHAAAGGHVPCLPAKAGERYFTAVPGFADGAEIAAFDQTKGIVLPVGGEITIPIRLVSDGHGPRTWHLSATEQWSPFTAGFDLAHQLDFTFDCDSGSDGDVRFLTIKRSPPDSPNVLFATSFAIQSTSGSETHSWVVAVGE